MDVPRRIKRKDVEEIEQYVRMELGLLRLSERDKRQWKEIRDLGATWGYGSLTWQHDYRRMIERMIDKGPHLGLWERTRGDTEKVLAIVSKRAPRRVYERVLRALREALVWMKQKRRWSRMLPGRPA